MQIDVISLFPEMFQALDYGIVGRALKNEILTVNNWNPRMFTEDKHQRVDDRPYGGGPGMVMAVQPLQDTLAAVRAKANTKPKVIYLSPQGKPLKQAGVAALAQEQHLVLLCGRYEGIDERLIELEVDEEVSLGDYVLSGGEFAAMVLIDAMCRLLPGALGHNESAEQDSFCGGLLDYPHYTRPEVYAGKQVPKVLLQGDHQAIQQWREQQALKRTWLRRKDLLQQVELSSEQQAMLAELIAESDGN